MAKHKLSLLDRVAREYSGIDGEELDFEDYLKKNRDKFLIDEFNIFAVDSAGLFVNRETQKSYFRRSSDYYLEGRLPKKVGADYREWIDVRKLSDVHCRIIFFDTPLFDLGQLIVYHNRLFGGEAHSKYVPIRSEPPKVIEVPAHRCTGYQPLKEFGMYLSKGIPFGEVDIIRPLTQDEQTELCKGMVADNWIKNIM